MLCYGAADFSVDVWQADGKLEKKKLVKKDGCLGVVVCMPIVFSRAEESEATFPKIKDVSFLCRPCKSECLCLIGGRQAGREGSERLLSVPLCDSQ